MKAIAYRSKKAKGARLELAIAKMLRHAGFEASRMPLSGASWALKSDIYSPDFPMTIEAKNKERHDLWQEWQQAKSQEKPFRPGLLVISGNHRPILAILELETLINLQAGLKEKGGEL